ncbi:MAG: hypothetical protein M1816_002776 [Peltula sp. TS41687]|nr:MAG: hypothetical protein M1816_002776 [Peltula sp. TS41687]
MANESQLTLLQNTLGYHFIDTGHLKKALTAADRDREHPDEHRDGNRGLALIGDTLIQCTIFDKALTEGASRGVANEALKAISKEHRAKRATALGIDTCITYSSRQQGLPSVRVLSLAVSAIVGAVFYDSEKDFKIARQVVEKLCIDSLTHNADVTGGQNYDLNNFCLLEDGNVNENDGYSMGQNTGTENMQGFVLGTMGTTECPESLLEDEFLNSTVQGTDDNLSLEGNAFTLLHHQEGEGLERDDVTHSQIELWAQLTASPARNLNMEDQRAPGSGQTSEHNGNEVSVDDSSSFGQIEQLNLTLPAPHRTDTVAPANLIIERTERSVRSDAHERPNRKRLRYAVLKSSQRKESLLDEYVDLEKRRCQNSGMPCPDSTFNRAIGPKPSMCEYETELKTMFFAIASPESLVQLQDAIHAYWRAAAGNSLKVGARLSNEERIELIEQLGGDLAHIGLIRRCHIYQLFVDNRKVDRTTDGFVNTTTQNIWTAARREAGNPSHQADAAISTAYIKTIYPSLQKGDPEYHRKYRSLSKLRRLGQTLDLFVEKFGYGVIGLLPLGTSAVAAGPVLEVSDKL